MSLANKSLALVVIRTENFTVLIERRYIAKMQVMPEERAVPLPALRIEELLGIQLTESETTPEEPHLLVIKQTQDEFALQVCGDVGLIELPCSAIHALPELVAKKNKFPYLRALAVFEQTIGLIIDPSYITL